MSAPQFLNLAPPQAGERITFSDGRLHVPDRPIIPFIEGDGTGPDIWRAARHVLDEAVRLAFGGKRQIEWLEVFAGEKAFKQLGNWLPEDTITAMEYYLVSIKGPLTTPIGKGMRSLNVAIRQQLDLYVCLRPVQYFTGVPSPVKRPEDVDMIIFRENTEDIYAGIEFELGSAAHAVFKDLLATNFPDQFKKVRFPESTAYGVKPVSREGSMRLVRAAIQYALALKKPSVTLVHKGNIMKFTEGGFREWGYQVAEEEFGAQCFTWRQYDQVKSEQGEDVAAAQLRQAESSGKLIVKDVIADIALQQVLTRPKEFSVVATLNLNGDYLSDALAAQVGGIGIAPGGNINYLTGHAVFEATHGTAPKYAGQNKVNPGSVILSGEMLLRHLGWHAAADLIVDALKAAIASRCVTYDFARLMRAQGDQNVEEVGCFEFGDAIVARMKK